MHTPGKHDTPQNGRHEEAGEAYDPSKKRGPPQRLEDTDASGDPLNDTGEDNHHRKSEP